MKKISSKIIISLFLALILWSGVGIFGMKSVNAEVRTLRPLAEACPNMPATAQDPGYPAWQACAQQWQADGNALATESSKSTSWLADGLTSFFKNALSGVGKTVADVVGMIIEYIALPIANTITAISGMLLDAALYMAVIYDYKNIVNTAIMPVWVLLRDTLNITFIFILLWISIKTILGISGTDTKKMRYAIILLKIILFHKGNVFI